MRLSWRTRDRRGCTASVTADPALRGRTKPLDIFLMHLFVPMTGLTAARDLQRAGCESFVVLEAHDRSGHKAALQALQAVAGRRA